MEVIVLLEYESAAALRGALLARIGKLALNGAGRLSFAASEPDAMTASGREILAVGFRDAATAQRLLGNWRAELGPEAAFSARLLQVEPLFSMEPLALMFP